MVRKPCLTLELPDRVGGIWGQLHWTELVEHTLIDCTFVELWLTSLIKETQQLNQMGLQRPGQTQWGNWNWNSDQSKASLDHGECYLSKFGRQGNAALQQHLQIDWLGSSAGCGSLRPLKRSPSRSGTVIDHSLTTTREQYSLRGYFDLNDPLSFFFWNKSNEFHWLMIHYDP